MSKSIQLKDKNNEKMYPHPYFPVGSIYLSVVNTNPTNWFGGTWELVAKGRTLVGVDTNDTDFNTVKKTGGSKTNKLDFDNYRYNVYNTGDDNNQISGFISFNGVNYGIGARYTNNNNVPVNNLQPYYTCYIWCRTA